MHEPRPVYRIAAAGLDPRDVRLIEIVFRHSQYNRFEFVLENGPDLSCADVLLANTAVPEGLHAVSAVRRLPRHVPVIAAVPRGVPSPARHAISIDRLTLQLLPILNRVVETEFLSPETQPMTMPLPHDDAQFASAWPQPGVPASALQVAPAQALPGSAAAARLPATNAASPARAVAPPSALPVRTHRSGPGAAKAAPAATSARVRQHADAAAREAKPARTTDHRAVAAADDPLLRCPRILVVDDSPTVRQQLGVAFTRMGFACDMAASGEAALERLAAARYDLAMVDVMIPDTDGYRLTREIRKRHRGMPVIILSSKGSPFDHARGLLAGCKAYLAKPVPLRELESAILKALRKSLAPDEYAAMLSSAAAARGAAAGEAAGAANRPGDAASAETNLHHGLRRPARPSPKPDAARMPDGARI